MDKKLIAVAAVSAAVGAAAALGVVAVLSKVKTGKYCICLPCKDDSCPDCHDDGYEPLGVAEGEKAPEEEKAEDAK